MRKAVDAFAGERGDDGHQILILGNLSQIVGHAYRVHRGTQDGIVYGVFNLLSKHIDPEV